MNEETTTESLAKGRTYGVFRCLNCFERVSAPTGSTEMTCSHCGYAWRIAWIAPDFPRIRGPVWDVNRQLAEKPDTEKAKKGKK